MTEDRDFPTKSYGRFSPQAWVDDLESVSPRAGESPRRRRGLSVFRFKVIGALLLALSVGSTTVVPKLVGADRESLGALTFIVLCEIISWAAIPIYAWLLVEGYRHTHNIWAYAGKLVLLACVCEAPYDFTTTGQWWNISTQNPVFGLALALLVLALVARTANTPGRGKWALITAYLVAGVLWALIFRVGMRQSVMNIGVVLIGFVLIFYFLVRHENTMMMTAGLFGAVSFIAPGVGVAFLHYRNGELGYQHSWTPWVFYAVYPVLLCLGCAFA
ncbi:MAG: conjugal transfer protein TraX [Arcanobacterium sp.]|nr:conjugal transfer protein TraX [Arcanobacterium sp.]